jgi:hypothetical protein
MPFGHPAHDEAGPRGDEHGQRDDDRRDEERVQRVAREVDEVERLPVGLERRLTRDELGSARRRQAGPPQ